MNVALAIWKINPSAIYRLTDSNASSWEDILEWFGPGEKPTPTELEDAWNEYLTEQGEQEAESTYAQQIQEDAEAEVVSIPGYSIWPKEQADTWYEDNVRTPLSSATTVEDLIPVIEKMATAQWAVIRMVLAIRNKLWWWLQSQE